MVGPRQLVDACHRISMGKFNPKFDIPHCTLGIGTNLHDSNNDCSCIVRSGRSGTTVVATMMIGSNRMMIGISRCRRGKGRCRGRGGMTAAVAAVSVAVVVTVMTTAAKAAAAVTTTTAATAPTPATTSAVDPVAVAVVVARRSCRRYDIGCGDDDVDGDRYRTTTSRRAYQDADIHLREHWGAQNRFTYTLLCFSWPCTNNLFRAPQQLFYSLCSSLLLASSCMLLPSHSIQPQDSPTDDHGPSAQAVVTFLRAGKKADEDKGVTLIDTAESLGLRRRLHGEGEDGVAFVVDDDRDGDDGSGGKAKEVDTALAFDLMNALVMEAAAEDRVANDKSKFSMHLQTPRHLQTNCWDGSSPKHQWHPVYSAGWMKGYCAHTIDCYAVVGYSTQLACCKAVRRFMPYPILS